jgi:hypothetical protein
MPRQTQASSLLWLQHASELCAETLRTFRHELSSRRWTV